MSEMQSVNASVRTKGGVSPAAIWTLSGLLHIALLWGLSTMNLARGIGGGSEPSGVSIEGRFLGKALDDSGEGNDVAETEIPVSSAPEIQLVSASVSSTELPESTEDEIHRDESPDRDENGEEEPLEFPPRSPRQKTDSSKGPDRAIGRRQSAETDERMNRRRAPVGRPAGAISRHGRAARSGSGNGTGEGTTFFDIPGHGSKFVYVIDRSDSMQNVQRLSAARTEMLASLEQLSEGSFVQVIFYNHDVLTISTREGLSLERNHPAQQRKFAQFAAGIEPDGGTDHLRALFLALKLSPDAIFLLTDADEPRLRAADLEKLNRANRRRVPIHTVELGVGPLLESENFLMRLAQQSGGTYRYWNIEDIAMSTTPDSR